MRNDVLTKAYADIVRLAAKYPGGRIPRLIPACYVRTAYEAHRHAKGLRTIRPRLLPAVIHLGCSA